MSKVRDEGKAKKRADEAVAKQSGFSSPYDFYALSDEECAEKIGKPFRCNSSNLVFVPVSVGGFNYNRPTGLVGVAELRGSYGNRTGDPAWCFSVYAKSPDDLDIFLEFPRADVGFRNEVIEYICELSPMGFTYRDLFVEVQMKFKVGNLIY